MIAEDNLIEPEEHLTLSSTADTGALAMEEDVARDNEENDQNNVTEEAMVTPTLEDMRDEAITKVAEEETENKPTEESVAITDSFDELKSVQNENEGDIETHSLTDIESNTQNSVQERETTVTENTEDKVLESVPQTEIVEERITQLPAEIEMSPTKELPDFAFVEGSVAGPIEDEEMEADKEERKSNIDEDALREDENMGSQLLQSSDDQTVCQSTESPQNNDNPISTEPLETQDPEIQTAEIQTHSETPPPTPEIDDTVPLHDEEEEKGMSESRSNNAKETDHDIETEQNVVAETYIEDESMAQSAAIESEINEGGENEKNDEEVIPDSETPVESGENGLTAELAAPDTAHEDHSTKSEQELEQTQSYSKEESETVLEQQDSNEEPQSSEEAVKGSEHDIQSQDTIAEKEMSEELKLDAAEDNTKSETEEIDHDTERHEDNADSENVDTNSMPQEIIIEQDSTISQDDVKGVESELEPESKQNGDIDTIVEKSDTTEEIEHDTERHENNADSENVDTNSLPQEIIIEQDSTISQDYVKGVESELEPESKQNGDRDTIVEKSDTTEEIDHDIDRHEDNADSENVDTNLLPQEIIIEQDSTISQDDVKGVESELEPESKQKGDIDTIVEKSDTDNDKIESVDQSSGVSHDTIFAEQTTDKDFDENVLSGDIESSEIAPESRISLPDKNIDQTEDSHEDLCEKSDENAIFNTDIQQSESENNAIEPITKEDDNSVVETVLKADIDQDQSETLKDGEVNEMATVNGIHDERLDMDQIDTPEDQRIEQAPQSGDDSQVSMKMMRGEVSAKTTYQRTSTGPIAISEVSPEGKFIMLENTSSGPNRKDVNLDGWKLRRTVDGKRDYIYNFRNFTLKAGKKVKILARGHAAEAGLNDLVFREEENWGVGSQVTTTLINDKDEEKASHVQKTNYN
ncbi:intermediate filament protein ifa-1-like isoform X1 [Dreissena polymorpha]|uniref:intermediate filament protein ifa-1-like isoform X1 n=1 Tax=Dreissena polymorpha TaxID=45954 RepID=UPI002264FCFB|nr:intermediate filament protein ifa-1-like isoform X1 [Dreissena polymorpha]